MRSSCKTQFHARTCRSRDGCHERSGCACTLYPGDEDRDDDTWWKVSRLCRCVKHIFSPSLSLSSLCHRRYTLSSVVSIYLVAGCPHVHRIARCTITQRKFFINWKDKSFIQATPMSVRFQMLCQWLIFVERIFQPIAKTEGDNWLVDEWTLRTMFLLARDHSFSHFTPVYPKLPPLGSLTYNLWLTCVRASKDSHPTSRNEAIYSHKRASPFFPHS